MAVEGTYWLEQWRWDATTETRRRIGGIIDDALEVTASKGVKAVGEITFKLHGNHRVVSNIQRDDKFKLYRVLPDGTKTLFTSAYWLNSAREYTVAGDHVTLSCFDRFSLLNRMTVAYRSDITDRSKFQDLAEGILKNLVTYNVTAAGVGGGPSARLASVPSTLWFSVVVEPNENRGAACGYHCQFDQLLDALTEVAEVGGLDFDLVEAGEDEFTFCVYSPTQGTDRRASLLFSLERANIRNPRLIIRNEEFKTRAFVGGQGEGVDRTVVTVPSDYTAGLTGTPYYAETFVDGRIVVDDDTTALRDVGRQALLREHKPVVDFDFEIVQTDQFRFDRDYFLGDLAMASFGGYTQSVKIAGASLQYTQAGQGSTPENLQIITETYPE